MLFDQNDKDKKKVDEKTKSYSKFSSSQRVLIEKYQDLIEDDLFSPIPDRLKGAAAQLIENQETWLREDANLQTDLQYFEPMITPIFRESMSKTSLLEVVGFQPINQKKSLFFVERFYYGNDDTNGMGALLSTTDRGSADADFKQFVVRVEMSAAQYAGIVVGTGKIKAAGGGGNDLGTIMYKEECYGGAKLLIKEATSESIPSVGTVSIDAPTATDLSMSHVWNNELGRSVILHSYGNYSTADGENLTSDWKTVKISLESVDVTAESHKLAFELSQETITDLAKTTGDDAMKRLTMAINWQLAMSINKKLFNLMSSNAEIVTTWTYSGADGRFEGEKIATLKSKIKYEQNRIATKTQKGRGNFAIVSVAVMSVIENLPGFVRELPNEGGDQAGYIKVGYLDGVTYYMSTIDAEYGDYVVLGYKGSAEHDAGVFYCPYVPLIVSHANDFANPERRKTAFSQRAAYEKNPYGAERYLTYFDVTLTGSTWA